MKFQRKEKCEEKKRWMNEEKRNLGYFIVPQFIYYVFFLLFSFLLLLLNGNGLAKQVYLLYTFRVLYHICLTQKITEKTKKQKFSDWSYFFSLKKVFCFISLENRQKFIFPFYTIFFLFIFFCIISYFMSSKVVNVFRTFILFFVLALYARWLYIGFCDFSSFDFCHFFSFAFRNLETHLMPFIKVFAVSFLSPLYILSLLFLSECACKTFLRSQTAYNEIRHKTKEKL